MSDKLNSFDCSNFLKARARPNYVYLSLGAPNGRWLPDLRSLSNRGKNIEFCAEGISDCEGTRNTRPTVAARYIYHWRNACDILR